VFDCANPVVGDCPHREIVLAAALGRQWAAASVAQNLDLAHEPGFEQAEVTPGPVVVSADWTKL
jgi:hypothetical protein